MLRALHLGTQGVSELSQKTDKGRRELQLGSSGVKRRVLDSNSSCTASLSQLPGDCFSAFVQSGGWVKTEMAVIASGMVVS